MQGLRARHADLVGVYVTGGGISGIAAALQESGDKAHLVLIGHECTAQTRAQLSERAIDVILDQDVRGHRSLGGGSPRLTFLTTCVAR